MPAGPQKSDYLYTNFLPNFPPISIPSSNEKHPILIKLGAFCNKLPKIHPIYVIWAPSSLMKPPPIAIPIFAKKCPKRQAHIRIPCQCENPPGKSILVVLFSIYTEIETLFSFTSIIKMMKVYDGRYLEKPFILFAGRDCHWSSVGKFFCLPWSMIAYLTIQRCKGQIEKRFVFQVLSGEESHGMNRPIILWTSLISIQRSVVNSV